jgi:DNA-binding NtrC family response regulator
MDWRARVNSVLIVDDESGIRELLMRWLSAEKYDIRDAPDAETALEEMTKAAADVVMCDVEMPGQGGLWLAGQLGQRFPATAIVLATALDSVPPVTSMQPSIVEYLVKPFKRELVVQAVSRGVQWHGVAVARGLAPSADGDRLTKWLESIEE